MAFRKSSLEGLEMKSHVSGLIPNPTFWKGKKILITGHTGFKGSWLTLWLHSMGAVVNGLALHPLTNPNLFSIANISALLASDSRIDIRDEKAVLQTLENSNPEIVFHLSAQPLVRASYADPISTFATNILGTSHILEAIRKVPSIRVAVVITTDKVYENREWDYPYREIDFLGGKDPYSASKACAEIITNCYRQSFFDAIGKSVSSARAGNVVGGGDWSSDRLIPDAIRAFTQNKPLILRYPDAVRPWQHVLDALSGYLILAEMQWIDPRKFGQAWNFAPDTGGEGTVGQIASQISTLWGDSAEVILSKSSVDPPEASLLRLDSSKARIHLNWFPRLSLHMALEKTVKWYKAWQIDENMQEFSLQQINEYLSNDQL